MSTIPRLEPRSLLCAGRRRAASRACRVSSSSVVCRSVTCWPQTTSAARRPGWHSRALPLISARRRGRGLSVSRLRASARIPRQALPPSPTRACSSSSSPAWRRSNTAAQSSLANAIVNLSASSTASSPGSCKKRDARSTSRPSTHGEIRASRQSRAIKPRRRGRSPDSSTAPASSRSAAKIASAAAPSSGSPSSRVSASR